MITKVYWATRILGYLACLAGIFLHLHHLQLPEALAANYGLPLVGLGFVAFFASYAIRAWIRLAPRHPASSDPVE